MKKQLLTLATVCAVALASTPAFAKDFKVAYVNVQRIVNEVNEAKRARTKLKKDFENKQKKLDQLQKNFEKEMASFEKGKGLMKPEVRMQTEARLKQKYTELHQTLMKLQGELAKQEAAMAQSIHGKIRKIVEAIGDRDGYNLILDNSEMKGTVLFFKRHLDLTDTVISNYNKKHK